MHEQPQIIILGNGPINTELAELIDCCPRVVRFNRCAAMPTHLGKRCTDLWLLGRGRQAQSLLTDPLVMPLEGISKVVVTDPAPNLFMQQLFKLIRRHGRLDHGDALFKHYGTGLQQERLTQQFRQSVLEYLLTLGPTIHKPYCPSSGTLAIVHYLKLFSKVHIAGFGFQGWKRHPWHLEKRYVSELIHENKVIMLD
tara:strand:+ start:559 stop:1149 length:591 start_codon:yes stop_codon:yes gene_type:complete